MNFSEIEVNQKFSYDGIEYQRIELQQKSGYGYVNAVKTNPTENEHYPGDTGYRHFYDDEQVN